MKPPPIERSSWLTLAVTSVVGFMVSLEITVISFALPEIRDAFPDASESTLSWIITAYNIGVASLLLVAGWGADRFGRKKVFLIGLTIFAIGSVGSGLAQSSTMLIGARLVQAIGGAMQFPAGLALLLPAFPVERRQMAIGIWGAMGGLAAALGPPIGGLLVAAFGWRSVFLVNVPVALLTVVLGRRWLAESTGDVPDRVDLVSIPVASVGVGAIVLAIVQGNIWGWRSASSLVTFAVGAVLIAIFIFRSRTHRYPLFDLGLFRIRSFSLGNLGTVFFACAFFSYFVPLPSFVQETWGWSATKAGLAIMPGPALATVLSPMSGRLADRIGPGLILATGGLAGVLAMAAHLMFTTEEPQLWLGLVLPGLLVGIAAGCSFAMSVAAAMRDV
ncbi:MAG: MFS transporter, partial [Acidimicrobiales bacterium]